MKSKCDLLGFQIPFLFMTYAEKLKDPRWQKKRLEILSRDNWTCQYCGTTKHTLHIHHFRYHNSGNPWESKNEDLTTFCEDCHWLHEYIPSKDYNKILNVIRRHIENGKTEDYILNPKITKLKNKNNG
ncbi:MAG: hypothetical protein RLZ95_1553 [Bacteroidota bacterium]|jgi:5-methylcytosine-specific restriction endonuclease McrA